MNRLIVFTILLLVVAQSLISMDTTRAWSQKDPAGWWNRDWHYRVPITVGPADFELINYPVEIELNFTELMADAGGPGGIFNPDSLRIIQYDKPNLLANPINQPDGTLFVPLKFDKGMEYNASSNADGIVTFLITGTIQTGKQLYFQLYFDTGINFTVPEYDTSLLESLYWMSRGQEFYGFNPGVESIYGDIEALHVVGLHNNTSVSVYDITSNKHSLIASGNVSLGGLMTAKIPDGAYFSVESNKPIVASMDDGLNGNASCYYPSRDGNMVGHEFYFLPYSSGIEWKNKTQSMITIHNIELSKIDIYSSGDLIFSVNAGMNGDHILIPSSEVCHII
jgi:hypothetical protein